MAFNKSFAIGGLGSESVAMPAAGAYFISGKIQLPRLASGSSGPSAVIATITNDTQSATILTSTAGNDGFAASFSAAADDVIIVALTSANAVDSSALNSVKCEVVIGSGQ